MLTVWALLLFLAMWVRSTAGGSFRIGKSFGKNVNIILVIFKRYILWVEFFSPLLLYTLKLCLFKILVQNKLLLKFMYDVFLFTKLRKIHFRNVLHLSCRILNALWDFTQPWFDLSCPITSHRIESEVTPSSFKMSSQFSGHFLPQRPVFLSFVALVCRNISLDWLQTNKNTALKCSVSTSTNSFFFFPLYFVNTVR